MKKLLPLLLVPALFAGLLTPANAGPTYSGWSTDNVEFLKFVPFDQSTSTGATVVGKYLYLTSWKNLSIYDISDPENPSLTGYAPWGTGYTGEHPFMFENEQVATDGKILLFSESVPGDQLHVWDVEDKSNPIEIAQLDGAGDHTMSCILKCTWAYGSDGAVVDLRDPSKPKQVMNKDGSEYSWHEDVGIKQGAHDVYEYKNGFILASTLDEPFRTIDVRDPLHPKLVYTGNEHPHPWGQGGFLFHSGLWPNGGKDKWLLMQGEDNANPRCNKDNNGPFMTWTLDKKARTFHEVDQFALDNGTYQDGAPPVNALGCSAHWFTTRDDFRNGGLVAIGYYEHGTRFLDVDSAGKIHEKGWFVPFVGSTSAAYWVTHDIVYSVDYGNGLYILKYHDK